MSCFRVYINPKDDQGNFTGYQEVTEDVVMSSLSTITEKLDNDAFDVGNFKFNSLNIKLRNEHGKYSDVETVQSIFRDRRGGSKVRFNWQIQGHQTICGVAPCGIGQALITPQITLYDGILNDDASRLDIDDQQISFKVLSSNSIIDEVETPFSSLSNGDLFSAAILTVLDQAEITKILTVDVANINVGLDIAIDDISGLENTTVKESLDELLFGSNSVMHVRDNIIFIENRDGGAITEFTFTGQASNTGIEDIIKLSNISTGRNRVFNYWTWKDTTLLANDAISISANGIRKKELNFDMITNSSKRQSILEAQRDEFKDLKQEFDLTTFLNYDTLALNILDRVAVDYPTVLTEGQPGAGVPLYGIAIYGEAIYPIGDFGITIDVATPFKIMGRKINAKNKTVTFSLKEV